MYRMAVVEHLMNRHAVRNADLLNDAVEAIPDPDRSVTDKRDALRLRGA